MQDLREMRQRKIPGDVRGVRMVPADELLELFDPDVAGSWRC
jgi:hypothetical protein